MGGSTAGDTVFTGKVTSDSVSTQSVQSSAVTCSALTVNGDATMTGDANCNNLMVNTNADISGNLDVAGIGIFGGNVSVSGTFTAGAFNPQSITNPGQLTQNGAAIFGSTITLSTPPTTELGYTSTAGSLGYNFTLSGNYVRIDMQDMVPGTGSYTVYNAFINATTTATTTFKGQTSGSNGNANVDWSTSQIYLHNGGATAAIPIGKPLYGYIEFRRLASNKWSVYGHNIFNGTNNYYNVQTGSITTIDGKLRLNMNPTNTPTGTVYLTTSAF